MAVNGGYRYIYYTQCKSGSTRLQFKDIPIDFSVEALGIDAKIEPYEKELKDASIEHRLPLWMQGIVDLFYELFLDGAKSTYKVQNLRAIGKRNGKVMPLEATAETTSVMETFLSKCKIAQVC